MNIIKIAGGTAAVIALVSVLAFGRSTSTPVDLITPVPTEEEMAAAKVKLAEGLLQFHALAKEVPTETITPDPPPAKAEAEAQIAPPAPPKREVEHKKSSGDTCSRHKMHRVYTDKYRWRCKK